MELKSLYSNQYAMLAIKDGGGGCPVLDFLTSDDANTESYRTGLLEMMEEVSKNGFDSVPTKWVHEANKKEQIYEFIKGPIRVFFFKGKGNHIAVCVTSVRKTAQKADKSSVALSVRYKKEYFSAIARNQLNVEQDDES